MKLSQSFGVSFLVVALMWLLKTYEYWADLNLTYYFGIYPLRLRYLIGVFVAPFLHHDFMHLFSNSIPLFVLGGSLLFFYPTIARQAITYIYVLTGLAVWLLARPSFHIGSSGLVYGFAGFLFFSGVFRQDFLRFKITDLKALVIALAVAFLYGGMVSGVLPLAESVSWESHLFGATAGAWTAFMLRNIQEIDHENHETTLPQTPNNNTYTEGYRNIETKTFKYYYTEKKKT